jgi:hypothetical protein
MDTVTPLLRIVDQLNTEKLTKIQATVDLMKAEQRFVKGYLWFNSETAWSCYTRGCQRS